MKMALSDELLMKVEQPARYLGNEVNAANKDKSKAEVSFCMCFPDVYEIGMSHLGIQILYDMFNRFEDTYCDRVYSPWIDLDKMMREQDIKLFAVESQEPVKSFDFLGITLQYEMCYTNILQILDLSGIALRSADRDINDPFVIGGGPCTYNPEPIAPFFEPFLYGRGVRLSIVHFLIFIKSGAQKAAQGKTFYMRQLKFLAYMYLLYTMSPTRKMELLMQ